MELKTVMQEIRYLQKPIIIRKCLLICGILSSVLYVGTDLLAVLRWKEYSIACQTVSELIAVNAPTRSLVSLLFVVYALLIYAFGIGVWILAGRKSILRFVAVLIVGKEILGLVVTLFFPIHLRGVEATLSDTLHGILTAVGVFLCMFPAMGLGATVFGKRFRYYTVVTILIFLIFGVLAGMNQPSYVANLSTPFMGIWERINIYGYMIWIVVLAITLLREKWQKSLRQ